MAEYNGKPQILTKRGMNVTLPGDRLTQEWFQYLENMRSYLIGEWRQRPGTEQLFDVDESIYHITRLNNNNSGTFRRFVGTTNGNVYVDNAAHNSASIADSGYGGKEYSSVISRPDRSTEPYLFIGSDLRNGKFDTVGARTEWGLSAPIQPLEANFLGANYKIASHLYFPPGAVVFEGTTTYTPSSGAIGTSSRTSNIFPLTAFYDNGGINTPPGMASITLTSQVFPPWTDQLQPGMFIDFVFRFGGPPASQVYFGRTIVEEVIFPIANTAITAIAYDTGSTGPCSITLQSPTEGLKRNCLVNVNGQTTRVLSVTRDQDGIPSFRCDLPFTAIVGMPVTGVYCFRAYIDTTWIVGSAPLTTYATSGVWDWTGITAGLQTATATRSDFNLAVTEVPQGGINEIRSFQADDIFHISINANYGAVSEIQVQFDVNDGTFTQNYYFLAIRPPDLFGSYIQNQVAIMSQQNQVTIDQLDKFVQDELLRAEKIYPPQDYEAIGDIARQFLDTVNIDASTGLVVGSGSGTVSVTNNSGTGQWAEIFVPIGQFQRVGTGIFDWSNVQAVRVTVNATTTTSISFGSLYIRGTYGPNSKDIPPYTYTYRARNTLTGARSNPSPPTRYTTDIYRGLVELTIPPYPDPQADVIDIFRQGGVLTTPQLTATIPSSQASVFDILPDSIAIRNPTIEVDRFKPWISSDFPLQGVCNTAGTSVLRQSGDVFDTRWIRGTQIIIGDRVYSIYTNPASTDFLTLNESAGAQTNVPFYVPEPILDGQTYLAVFGPYAGATGEFIFAVGDPRNPGYIYWTNGNDIESTSDVNSLELCNPSETLMNGCVLDGIVYCFSDKRAWRILPSFTGGQTGGGSDFYPQETAIGKGLCSRWGLAVGDAIYFVSYDGVYRSRGDAIESLTDESLAPLFRRDGVNTSFQVPVSPLDLTQPDEISLIYSYDGLYLHFLGIDGVRYVGYMSFLTGGWTFDTIIGDAIIRSSREIQSTTQDIVLVGTESGRVLQRSTSALTDAGTPISCRVWDREEIWDSLRATKQVGDTMVDVDPANATITPTLRYDNNTSNDVLSNITGNGRDQFVRDINNGAGRVVRGAALDLAWTDGSTGIPKVYAWEPSALIKPEETINRASDWDAGGYTGTKWLQGFRLRGDTAGLAKSFQVEIDGGVFVESFTFTANGEQVQTFWLNTPVVCHEMRLLGTDSDSWRFMGVEWIFEPEPEMAAVWETQVTNLDLPFFSHIREMMIAHRSTTDITMTVTTDGVSNTYTITNGSGERVRTYLPLLAIKAKYHKFRFTSSQPFGLWIVDLETKAGNWGRVEAYATIKPFGDISRSNGGARI
jgi:hypothetical protein